MTRCEVLLLMVALSLSRQALESPSPMEKIHPRMDTKTRSRPTRVYMRQLGLEVGAVRSHRGQVCQKL